MKKNELQLLFVVLGILAAVMSWQFVYRNFNDKTAALEAENATLKERVDKLEILEAKKDEYLDSIDAMQAEEDRIVQAFPAGVLREDQIMYLYNMELVDANEVRVPAVSMSAPEQITYPGSLTSEDGYELTDDNIGMYRLPTTVNIMTTNNGLKNVLNYIYGIQTRKSVDSVNLTVSNEGYLTGSVGVNFYFLTGTDVPYIEQDISGVWTGTGNIFGSLNGGAYGAGAAGTDAGADAQTGEDGAADEDAGDADEN